MFVGCCALLHVVCMLLHIVARCCMLLHVVASDRGKTTHHNVQQHATTQDSLWCPCCRLLQVVADCCRLVCL